MEFADDIAKNEGAVFAGPAGGGGGTTAASIESSAVGFRTMFPPQPTEPPNSGTSDASETVSASPTAVTHDPNPAVAAPKSAKGGFSDGAKIGIGVAIPLILILLGVGIFFFLRRKKQKQRSMLEGKAELGEDMTIVNKNGQHFDDNSSSPTGPAGSTYMHPSPPPQAPNGQMYAPTAMQESSAYDAAIVPSPGPVMSRSPVDEEELMNRPVSPDLLTEEHTSHGSAGPTAAGSVRERGSIGLDEDREMQWILEEERKAKERREQQGRLPTHGA